jgi:hypothetical protein
MLYKRVTCLVQVSTPVIRCVVAVMQHNGPSVRWLHAAEQPWEDTAGTLSELGSTAEQLAPAEFCVRVQRAAVAELRMQGQ